MTQALSGILIEVIESFELWPESNGQAGSFRLTRPSSRTRASD